MKSPVNILAIETAGDVCSVAVRTQNGDEAGATLLRPRSHAEMVVPMAKAAAARASIDLRDLEAVAVSAGPGSYTGLRIGVSSAKGFCAASGATLVGVPTTAAYARNIAVEVRRAEATASHIAVALRARADQVYFSLLEIDGTFVAETLLCTLSEAAKHVESVLGESAAVAIGGSAAAALAEVLDNRGQWFLQKFLPYATAVAELGLQKLQRGEEDDLETFEPYYLKDYIARVPELSLFDRLTF